MLARAHRDDDAGPVSRADDHVARPGRTVHEVPRAQGALIALDDQQPFARDDEEVLLVRLPVIHRHRLARPEREHVDAELLELVVVSEYAHAASTLGRTPARSAGVDDEPAGTCHR